MSQQSPNDWLAYAKKSAAENSIPVSLGQSSLILEWKQADIQSKDLAEFKKGVCELACQALAPIEVEFLKVYPHAASQELFLKACAPFFEKESEAIDWIKIQTTIESTLRQFYQMDVSCFGAAVLKPLLNDAYFPVTLKDEKGVLMGFALFAVTPALPYGDVKLITIAVEPKMADREHEKLLMSSIFRILPKTERIFLYVRPTHETALSFYSDLGFHRDANPIQDPNHKVDTKSYIPLEYKTNQSSSLQAFADGCCFEISK